MSSITLDDLNALIENKIRDLLANGNLTANLSDLNVNNCSWRNFGACQPAYAETITYDNAYVQANENCYFDAPKSGFLGIRLENFRSGFADEQSGKYRVYFDAPISSQNTDVIDTIVPITAGDRVRISLGYKNPNGNCVVMLRPIYLQNQL